MLQKTTIDFLKSLKKNNNKPWFDENRKIYEASKQDFEIFVQAVISVLSKVNEEYALLKPKDCMFRINRDVRFSKDKSPYKTNFGAGFTIGGKKSNLAGFYIHIEPGSCFIGGGVWMPDNEMTKKIRQEIDYNFKEFERLIHSKKFKETFGDLSVDNKLVNAPKGYEIDNIAIEYLKLKSFTVSCKIDEKIILTNEFLKEIKQLFTTIHPLLLFLNRAIVE